MQGRRCLRASIVTVLMTISGMSILFAAEKQEKAQQGVLGELLLLKEETVSIAVRHEQPISEAPSNVYVITDEDIRQSGATDLPTVLRRIPGIEVMQVTGADFNVSVRGDNQLGENKMLVMVDGRPIYIDVQGTLYWKAIPVTLPEIKRIEVLKGPASVLYGFNAFDGIINIITKSPEEIKGSTLQFGGGEFGTISSAAVHAGTVERLGYRLSVGHDQNGQWRNRNGAAFRSYKFNVQTEYTLNSLSKVTMSGGLVDSNRFDGLVVATAAEDLRPNFGYAQAIYERKSLFIRAFWNSYKEDGFPTTNPTLAPLIRFSDRNNDPQLKLKANTYNVEGQNSIDLWNTHRLTYGINYRYNTLDFNFNDRYRTENRLGFYIQDEWRPTPTINLVGGVRYDLDTFIHPTVSPRVSLLYNPTKEHSFRATVAIGYRPPTLIETHLDSLNIITFPTPTPSPPPIPVKGSDNLSPEKIISYEIGYQGWYLKHRARIRASLFLNHISNLIAFGAPSPTQPGGVADIYGGEVGTDFLITHWLSGFMNFSYQEIGQSIRGEPRRGAPRLKYNAGLRGEWENGLSGEAALHYVGSAIYPINQAFFDFAPFGVIPPNQRVGSYFLLNLRTAYRFWQQKAGAGYLREAEVAVSVFNALNDRHREHPLGDIIGSRVMGWITIKY